RAGVFAGCAQTEIDRIQVLGIEGEKLNHIVLGRFAVLLLKRLAVPARVDERLPLVGFLERKIQLQVKIDFNESCDVFRAFGVPPHPIDGIRDAAEEGSFTDHAIPSCRSPQAPRCPCFPRPATSSPPVSLYAAQPASTRRAERGYPCHTGYRVADPRAVLRPCRRCAWGTSID